MLYTSDVACYRNLKRVQYMIAGVTVCSRLYVIVGQTRIIIHTRTIHQLTRTVQSEQTFQSESELATHYNVIFKIQYNKISFSLCQQIPRHTNLLIYLVSLNNYIIHLFFKQSYKKNNLQILFLLIYFKANL